jgi:hypothetical protein
MKSTILAFALASFVGTAVADDVKLVATSNGHGGTTFLYRRDTPTVALFPIQHRATQAARPTHQQMEYNSHGQIIGQRTVAD